ncbi:hypothetical protein HK098_003135 [Nowakowskiella sp. JEL0407]|nr:hypothetical protein HK098_003135 [Nowakowskiella sp. JEL0407]
MLVIKLYAWENSFMKKILDVRELELKTLKKVGYLSSVFSFIWSSTPFLVSFLSFTMYSIIETEPLTSTKIFVSLSLFNLLQFPLSVLPSVITSLVEASVSVNRLRNFLLNEELDRDAVVHDSTINGPDSLGLKVERVTVKNGSFRWSKNSESPDLKNISFSVSDRTLLSICGRVGAGKSSILSALLGEMYKDHGEVFVHGSVAYVPQTAWIMNQTVRENILFGKKFDAAYYEQTIAACGLQQDLEMLPAGDLTEIGERGINLSGGQKQRISLARAVYARTDIYLLDDPLSAVDAHVGAHIFEKVLGPRGLLKDKCRIFVTHAIQFIPQSDLILNLSNGSIDEIGTYDELMSWESNTKTLLREYGKRKEEDKESIDIEDENEPHSKQSSAKKPDTAPAAANGQVKEGKLMTKEESAKGAVAWDVYISYGQACGVITVIIYLIFATMSQMLSVGQNLYLADWASSNDNKKRDEVDENVFQRLTVYGILGLVSIRSARITHEAMLKTVLHAPQSFFDVTPLGRILNRFSKDQYAVDEVLPRTFQMFFRTLFNVISVLFVNAIATPLFLVFTLPLGFLYHHFQRYYLATSRELKRLDSTTRSPIYAHFSETLGGVVTIRAYRMDARFMQANDEKVDYNQKAYYASISSNRWLAVRLEFIGSLIVFGSAFFAVLTIYFYGTIPASVVGLMLTYSLNVTQTLNWWVRQSCEIETNIVSVERIKEYSELPTEAAEYTSYPLPDQWPDKGIIKFDSYSTKYRAELDLVLRQISFETKAGEKIGIVGRTGAGKSSLTLSLFRMIEPTDGSILIDGEDITKIGLQDLRSRITIIPQDPVLFAGTVRSNLDPFTQYDDEAVWKSLESANLKDKIMEMDGKLEAVVVQGGENFSVGQRQLVCLARALLRKSKILVLDEATAAIDVETDDIIQKVIRREFSDCTTLTIAHRINTVIDCDRILVLDKGQVAEFDSPEKLLADKRSIFYGLASEAGLLL